MALTFGLTVAWPVLPFVWCCFRRYGGRRARGTADVERDARVQDVLLAMKQLQRENFPPTAPAEQTPSEVFEQLGIANSTFRATVGRDSQQCSVRPKLRVSRAKPSSMMDPMKLPEGATNLSDVEDEESDEQEITATDLSLKTPGELKAYQESVGTGVANALLKKREV